jgi:hypothetical protein
MKILENDDSQISHRLEHRALVLFSFRPRRRLASIGNLAVWIAVATLGNFGCGGGRPQQPITVTVDAPQSVQAGTTAQIFATVSAGAAASVTWAVTCSGNSCGSVSPTSTGSGQSTTYTAPATLPSSDLTVTLTATSMANPQSSGSASILIPSVAVAVAPGTSAVPSGGTQQFIANVTGGPKNAGVTWSLTKSYSLPIHVTLAHDRANNTETTCDSSCGTVSPVNSASGAPVTYTAPASPPTFPTGSKNGTLLLVATSVADNIVTASASITISPISISVSPAAEGVLLNTTQQLSAAVVNDGSNSGVSWTLTQNGSSCSPLCGTIVPATTASGASTTYTAPAATPGSPAVTITATSIEDNTKSGNATMLLKGSTDSGSESLLKGQYAFQLQGFDSGGNPVGMVGSFAADGTGTITGGEEDSFANLTAQSDATIEPGGGAYSIGPDHRGFLALATSPGGTTYFRFALGSLNGSNIATSGRIIEFDDTTVQQQRAVGTIRLQDPISFTAASFKGNFAFGVTGSLPLAGTFTSDGVSAISSGVFDFDGGADDIGTSLSSGPGATFTCCSANGRGTLNLQINTTAFASSNFVFYLVSGTDALVGTNIPLDMGGGFIGEAFGISSGTTFNAASLSGTSILRTAAQANPTVSLSTVSADGKSAATIDDNTNNAGTFTTNSTVLDYVVASNGRVTLSGGSTVLYLYGPNQGFVVGTDSNETFGILEPQATGLFSNASFSGAFMFGTENPSVSTVTMETGVLTAAGNGNVTGTSDQSSSAGLTQNQILNFTYTFPANGVGNVGSGTTAILISGTKLLFINNTSTTPTITVVEK